MEYIAQSVRDTTADALEERFRTLEVQVNQLSAVVAARARAAEEEGAAVPEEPPH